MKVYIGEVANSDSFIDVCSRTKVYFNAGDRFYFFTEYDGTEIYVADDVDFFVLKNDDFYKVPSIFAQENVTFSEVMDFTDIAKLLVSE